MRTEGLCHSKVFTDPTGNQTRDVPSRGAVPQPTASPLSHQKERKETHRLPASSVQIHHILKVSIRI
jgi:hypothetical protein